MNSYHVLSVSVVLAACSVYAGEITVDPDLFVSTASRAQVQEELRQFRASGINPWADDYNPLAGFHSGMTRADVKADYIADRDSAAAMNGEDSGSSYLARQHAPAQPRDTELATAR